MRVTTPLPFLRVRVAWATTSGKGLAPVGVLKGEIMVFFWIFVEILKGEILAPSFNSDALFHCRAGEANSELSSRYEFFGQSGLGAVVSECRSACFRGRRWDVLLPPCPVGPVPVPPSGCVAGRSLLALLRGGGCVGAGVAVGVGVGLGGGVGAGWEEEEVWDDDDEALARMEEREDRERGADWNNDDTFGSGGVAWEFGAVLPREEDELWAGEWEGESVAEFWDGGGEELEEDDEEEDEEEE